MLLLLGGSLLVCGGNAARHSPRIVTHRTPRQASVPAASQTTNIASNSARADVPLQDLSGAVPARDAAKLPRTVDQFRALKGEIESRRPAAEQAKRRSDLLNTQADDLRRRLDDSTARVQALEDEKGRIDFELARLVPEERDMSATFVKDREQTVRLLAVLERLQSDMPPVIAVRSDDALSAARGAMVLGDAVPRIYQAAAALSLQLRTLREKRWELIARQRDSVRVAKQLGDARSELDQLLAIKSQEAEAASAQ